MAGNPPSDGAGHQHLGASTNIMVHEKGHSAEQAGSELPAMGMLPEEPSLARSLHVASLARNLQAPALRIAYCAAHCA